MTNADVLALKEFLVDLSKEQMRWLYNSLLVDDPLIDIIAADMQRLGVVD